MKFTIDPKLDLVLERTADVPREMIWKAWTQPEQLKKWFCPRPWQTVACEIDLRPGGRFHTVMRSPEGQEFPNTGCYLEVTENERLIWTSALLPGYRPAPASENGQDMPFTAVVTLEAHGQGTKYTAIAIHRNEKEREAHEKMGFHEGWGIVFDQLVEHIKTGKG